MVQPRQLSQKIAHIQRRWPPAPTVHIAASSTATAIANPTITPTTTPTPLPPLPAPPPTATPVPVELTFSCLAVFNVDPGIYAVQYCLSTSPAQANAYVNYYVTSCANPLGPNTQTVSTHLDGTGALG